MAVGSYGIVRPSDVSPADVEILYHYVSGRTTDVIPVLKRLTPTIDYLTPVYHNDQTDTSNDGSAQNNEILGGLYNLKLFLLSFFDSSQTAAISFPDIPLLLSEARNAHNSAAF